MKILYTISLVLLLNLFKFNGAIPVENSKEEETTVEYLERLTPSSSINFIKHVGGLDIDGDENLVVFHRGSRLWTFDSFIGNEFNEKKYGPIEEDVIAVVDPNTLESFTAGANMFYMPHGITVDTDGYIWLTDVGMHQVFKFSPRNFKKPLLTLGTKLESGSDAKHFCKPTGIAVSRKNGDIFVSDGYCNRRIVQFDKDGKLVREMVDSENPMVVVHSIALVGDLVCAASREDGRIVCFDANTGEKKYTIKDSHMNTVYAIEYDPINEVIQAVTGENKGKEAVGLTFDASEANFGSLLKIWKPKHVNLVEAHDLAISLDGSRIYTGQLNGEIDEFYFERKGY